MAIYIVNEQHRWGRGRIGSGAPIALPLALHQAVTSSPWQDKMEDYLDDELPESVGGPAIEMSIFEMVPKLFLSDQTSSNRSEYDFLQFGSI